MNEEAFPRARRLKVAEIKEHEKLLNVCVIRPRYRRKQQNCNFLHLLFCNGPLLKQTKIPLANRLHGMKKNQFDYCSFLVEQMYKEATK